VIDGSRSLQEFVPSWGPESSKQVSRIAAEEVNRGAGREPMIWKPFKAADECQGPRPLHSRSKTQVTFDVPGEDKGSRGALECSRPGDTEEAHARCPAGQSPRPSSAHVCLGPSVGGDMHSTSTRYKQSQTKQPPKMAAAVTVALGRLASGEVSDGVSHPIEASGAAA
jgi:hypothetical protein